MLAHANPITKPGVVSCYPGREDVFITGGDDRMYVTSSDPYGPPYHWNHWFLVEPNIKDDWPMGSGPTTALSRKNNIIEIFHVGALSGNDDYVPVFYKYGEYIRSYPPIVEFNDPWLRATGWTDYPVSGMSPLISPNAPICTFALLPDDIYYFATGADGIIYQNWCYPDGRGNRINEMVPYWHPVSDVSFSPGAPVSAAVAAQTSGPCTFNGLIFIFAVVSDSRVYTCWFGEYGVHDWHCSPFVGTVVPPGSPVSAITRQKEGHNEIYIYVRADDGQVWTTWWIEGVGWALSGDPASSTQSSYWRPLGGNFPAGAQASVVAPDENSLQLFITGYDGLVYTSWWQEGNDWSSLDPQQGWIPIGVNPAPGFLRALQ